MQPIVLDKSAEEEISKFASVARVVVSLEYAYDVIDELYTNPARFRDSLYKLSRLARKVLNDIDSKLKEPGLRNEDKEVLEKARKDLQWWADDCRRFEQMLGSEQQERLRNEMIKYFATLAISPDWRSTKLVEIFKR